MCVSVTHYPEREMVCVSFLIHNVLAWCVQKDTRGGAERVNRFKC